jgi:hypothetical protein
VCTAAAARLVLWPPLLGARKSSCVHDASQDRNHALFEQLQDAKKLQRQNAKQIKDRRVSPRSILPFLPSSCPPSCALRCQVERVQCIQTQAPPACVTRVHGVDRWRKRSVRSKMSSWVCRIQALRSYVAGGVVKPACRVSWPQELFVSAALGHALLERLPTRANYEREGLGK